MTSVEGSLAVRTRKNFEKRTTSIESSDMSTSHWTSSDASRILCVCIAVTVALVDGESHGIVFPY